MEYCSLNEAFPELGSGPAPTGCKDNKAGAAARKEERKKAKRCKGPPLTFLESPGDMPLTDPDRPALRPQPETPPMNPKTGMYEHAPVDAPPKEAFADFQDPRPASQILASYRSEQPPADESILNTMPKGVAGPNKQQPNKLPKYFGANYDDEDATEEGFTSFTNIIGDDPGYRLATDFTQQFAGKGVEKAQGTEVLPVPSVKNVWKPLTPSGARTAFFNSLPAPGGQIEESNDRVQFNKDEFFKRLDTIYSRLDDLEARRSENAQTEVLMFVMSGIFVLFSMDLLVRKTGNVRVANRR